jgi:hypothetical protein
MPKARWSAFISLLLVFGSGILVGVVGYRLYTVNTATATRREPPPKPEEIRKRLLTEMHDRLGLDEKQVAQLDEIYQYTRQKFEAVHKRANAETRALWDEQTGKIRAILRPDQLPRYEQLRKERDAQREADRRKKRMEGKGPPPPRP